MPSSSGSGSQSPRVTTSSGPQNYESLPTPPPKSRGPRQSFGSEDAATMDAASSSHSRSQTNHSHHGETPLPLKQLAVLAFVSLCEQTALNSISPYLPEMVASFPGIPIDQVGLYVGAIASAFALAQFLTNYFWGYLSDRIGRKPVILMGTFLTAMSLIGFGFSTRLWHAIFAQAVMGLLNGNQGVVSTCLGELTDKTNQSKAFTWLPVIYGLGGITGPMVGGFFADKWFPAYPYLLPNLISAAILLLDLIVAAVWLDESLEDMKTRPNLFKRITNMFSSVWQFMSGSHAPTYLHKRSGKRQAQETSPLLAPDSAGEHENASDEEDNDDNDDNDGEDERAKEPQGHRQNSDGIVPKLQRFGSVVSDMLPAKPPLEARDRNTVLILVTFLFFQLANVSFNSVYPIFAEAAEPVGRNLSPQVIGLSLSFAGGATIIFQVGFFNRLKHKLGNKVTWRVSLFIFIIAFALMPFVPYKGTDKRGVRDDIFGSWYGKNLLYAFLGVVLLLKTIATIGGLTSALLLITNSARSPAVLGSLNGLAQTLSAAGRAIGPVISGGLFSLAYKVPIKGEFLPFGLFAGVSIIGFVLSLLIRGEYLESQDGDSASSTDGSDADSESGDDEETLRNR